jgi:hypothetical protein
MTLRTRERGEYTIGTADYKEFRANGTQLGVTQTTSPHILKVGEVQTTTDVVSSNFHTRVERGEIINNPFTSWTVSYAPSFSPWIFTKPAATGTAHRTSTSSSGPYGNPGDRQRGFVDGGNLFAEVSTEVAAKVAQTNVDGAVEALEARQTMELFDRRQWNLRDQVQKELRYAEKRGKRFPVSVPVAVMADNWLKYRFGLGPLLALLNDTIVVGSKIQTRRETARDGASTGGSDSFAFSIAGGYGVSDFEDRRSWEISARAGILYEYINFRNKYGFSLDQVPYAAWNMVPWSFVADWVGNMGTFISALTPRSGVRRLATWCGYHTTINQIIAVTSYTMTLSGWVVTQAPTGFTTIRMEGRRRIPHIFGPSLYIRENALKEIVTSKRIVDAFALTSQMFMKLMRSS